jgi:hypothetical protein
MRSSGGGEEGSESAPPLQGGAEAVLAGTVRHRADGVRRGQAGERPARHEADPSLQGRPRGGRRGHLHPGRHGPARPRVEPDPRPERLQGKGSQGPHQPELLHGPQRRRERTDQDQDGPRRLARLLGTLAEDGQRRRRFVPAPIVPYRVLTSAFPCSTSRTTTTPTTRITTA